MAQRVLKKLAKIFDDERVRLEKGIALAEEKLSAPIEAKASHYLASEIRAHVKGLVDDAQNRPMPAPPWRGLPSSVRLSCVETRRPQAPV